MIRVVAAVVVVLGGLFVYGFVRDSHDRLSIKALVEKRLITVVVTMPDATDGYRWLSVYGCSAELTETGSVCNGYWEMESSRELHGYKQALIPWRDVPSGTMKVIAIAFDGQHRALAQAQLTVLRGQ